MTLQPIPSEFLYIRGQFSFLFYQCTVYSVLNSLSHLFTLHLLFGNHPARSQGLSCRQVNTRLNIMDASHSWPVSIKFVSQSSENGATDEEYMFHCIARGVVIWCHKRNKLPQCMLVLSLKMMRRDSSRLRCSNTHWKISEEKILFVEFLV